MAKIINFKNYFHHPLLTTPMITTLLIAHRKEKNNEPIGPIDLKGSFSALLRKEYIDSKIIMINGKKVLSWYLTELALQKLDTLTLI